MPRKNERGSFEAVILDYGAVLCHRPFPHEIARLAQVFGVTPENFVQLYAGPRRVYDRGDLTTREYWASVAQDAGVPLSADTIDRLAQWDKEMWSRANDEMTAWLASLGRAGYQTALLSNMHWDMVAHIRSKFAWLENFDQQVFSSEMRMVKPDRALYRACLAKLGTQPGQTMFIDDQEENVMGARAVGMSALRFRSVAQLRRDLQSAGFRHLPEPLPKTLGNRSDKEAND